MQNAQRGAKMFASSSCTRRFGTVKIAIGDFNCWFGQKVDSFILKNY